MTQFENTNEMKSYSFTRYPTTCRVHKTILRVSQRARQPEHESMLHLCMYVQVVCGNCEPCQQKKAQCMTRSQERELRRGTERGHYNYLSAAGPSQWKEGVKRWERKSERWRRIGQRIGEIGVNYAKWKVSSRQREEPSCSWFTVAGPFLLTSIIPIYKKCKRYPIIYITVEDTRGTFMCSWSISSGLPASRTESMNHIFEVRLSETTLFRFYNLVFCYSSLWNL